MNLSELQVTLRHHHQSGKQLGRGRDLGPSWVFCSRSEEFYSSFKAGSSQGL